jgi:hypothetical protein
MTSIIKVDTIQTAAGAAPTVADLGVTIPVASVPTLTAAQMPAGSTLQTVQGIKSGAWSASTSTLVDVGLAVNITTVSANSKILVTCAFRAQMQSGDNKGGHFALRSSLDNYASNLTASVMVNDWGTWNQEAGALEVLHTTGVAIGSAITYKLFGGDSRFGSALYVNDPWGYANVESRITAQEIKA